MSLPQPAASSLSRQRLCCQLGYFFLFIPFFFSSLPASILKWFPGGAGTQPSLETSSQGDLSKPHWMSAPGLSCHPHWAYGGDASGSAWWWAAVCGKTQSPGLLLLWLCWSGQNLRAGMSRRKGQWGGCCSVFSGGEILLLDTLVWPDLPHWILL